MIENKHLTISELQAKIKESIDRAHPLPYWVTAEISELKVNYSGHCYMELVEKGGDNHVPKAKISAVIWRGSYVVIEPYFKGSTSTSLTSGLKVLVKVVISYHQLYGLSLQIIDIEPSYTLGEMQQQRKKTIAQLQADGIYDMNRELDIPLVIQRIAVISSRNAAGYEDFTKQLTASTYYFDVSLYDAFMQGEASEDSIIASLGAIAENMESFDAVVIIRGGGSQSDLGCFDSYRLCSHIAQFPLPIITGIGHDKDQSVADLVAAMSLKTPTAVAVYLCDQMAEFDALLEQYILTMRERVSAMIEGKHRLIDKLLSDLRIRIMETIFSYRTTLSQNENKLRERAKNYLNSQTKELSLLSNLIDSHDPQHILELGFAIVRHGGKVVKNTNNITVGDTLTVSVNQGEITTQVTEIKALKA